MQRQQRQPQQLRQPLQNVSHLSSAFWFWIFGFNVAFDTLTLSMHFLQRASSHCRYQISSKKIVAFFSDSSHLPKEVVVPFSIISGELQVVFVVQMFSPRIFFRLKSDGDVNSSQIICTLIAANAQCSYNILRLFEW